MANDAGKILAQYFYDAGKIPASVAKECGAKLPEPPKVEKEEKKVKVGK